MYNVLNILDGTSTIFINVNKFLKKKKKKKKKKLKKKKKEK